MIDNEAIKQAKKCPYYGCAGTRICTYYSWTTHCPYPSCDKEDLFYSTDPVLGADGFGTGKGEG